MLGFAALRTGVTPGGALAGPWVRDPLWTRARAVPSLDLRFADNKSLVDAVTGAQLVTHTRASSGTFVGSDGVLLSAVTNLLLRSEEFEQSPWTVTGNNASVSANQEIAPNGTLTADKLVEDTSASTFHRVQQTATLAAGSVTYSVYLKAAGRNFALLVVFNGTNSRHIDVKFNLLNGTVDTVVNGSASITNVGNGWFRCSVTSTTTVSANNIAYVYAASVTGGGATYEAYTGDGTSGLYLWGAQLEQSATVGEYIPTTSAINSAPRFDHNPTTGESLGLLVEEARTNSIVNSNSMTAVVAGSPGTLPTGWSAQGNTNGWTREVVGSGSLGALNYVDIRFSGTPTGSQFAVIFQAQGVVAASNGQSWSASVYHQLVGGAISNIGCFAAPNLWTSLNTFISTLSVTPSSFNPTSTLQRFTSGGTISAVGTAFINWGITFTNTPGSTYDFTIRFAGPQLELGAFPTSYIPTTTATVTRAADVASITGSNFSSWYNQTEGTVFVDSRREDSATTQHRPAAYAGNSGNTNRIEIRNFSIGVNTRAYVNDGGSAQANFDNLATIPASTSVKVAIAIKLNDFAAAANGLSPQADTSGTVPVVDRFEIGTSVGHSNYLNGTIKRLTYFPARLSVLQRITQP